MNMRLKYIGRGAALPHVPARDLTEQDFIERRELWADEGITEAVILNSGLYEKPINEKPARKPAGKESE